MEWHSSCPCTAVIDIRVKTRRSANVRMETLQPIVPFRPQALEHTGPNHLASGITCCSLVPSVAPPQSFKVPQCFAIGPFWHQIDAHGVTDTLIKGRPRATAAPDNRGVALAFRGGKWGPQSTVPQAFLPHICACQHFVAVEVHSPGHSVVGRCVGSAGLPRRFFVFVLLDGGGV